MARGYYTRTTLTAWNWRGGQLTQLWKFDSNTTPRDSMNRAYTGQGAHSLSVANVDADNGQEIIYGAMTVDHNGAGLCSSGNNHGDALHVGDFNPSRAGIEVFMCNEDGSQAGALRARRRPPAPTSRRRRSTARTPGAAWPTTSRPATRARRCGRPASTGLFSATHQRQRRHQAGLARTSSSGGTPTRRASWRTARRSASSAAARC